MFNFPYISREAAEELFMKSEVRSQKSEVKISGRL
jgi:hypothetical protein